MKKTLGIFILILSVAFSACGPKPYYATNVGKKKQRYYNDIQFGKDAHPKKRF